jgi:hypothetical protein
MMTKTLMNPWKALNYAPLDPSNILPNIGELVVVIVKPTAGPPEWLFARYAGDGQFKIETQAELQSDGRRRKLTSTCHASFVTHWQYLFLPFQYEQGSMLTTECDQCHRPANSAAVDLQEVENDGIKRLFESSGPTKYGCELHPAVSITYDLDGHRL